MWNRTRRKASAAPPLRPSWYFSRGYCCGRPVLTSDDGGGDPLDGAKVTMNNPWLISRSSNHACWLQDDSQGDLTALTPEYIIGLPSYLPQAAMFFPIPSDWECSEDTTWRTMEDSCRFLRGLGVAFISKNPFRQFFVVVVVIWRKSVYLPLRKSMPSLLNLHSSLSFYSPLPLVALIPELVLRELPSALPVPWPLIQSKDPAPVGWSS